jgi:hypothetical protein
MKKEIFSAQDWMDHVEEMEAKFVQSMQARPKGIPFHVILVYGVRNNPEVQSILVLPEDDIVNDAELRYPALYRIGAMALRNRWDLKAVTTIAEAWLGTQKGMAEPRSGSHRRRGRGVNVRRREHLHEALLPRTRQG